MTPKRIQRKRTKGWRMPEGAVYVGRPSRWGNKWRVDDELGRGLDWDAETVVALYRADRKWGASEYPDLQREWLAPLRGRDLVCWCPLEDDQGNRVPCHADVLLELANR